MINTNIETVDNYFLNIKRQSKFLSLLYDYFESNNIEFGFLGGAVRAAINDSITMPRDFDIIFDSSDIDFDNFLKDHQINFNINSFGGRKICADNIVFDIWSLSKHHLIAENKYHRDFENIPKTTFINYDSIFYDYTKQKLIGKFLECENHKVIDFVGNKKYQKLNSKINISICKLALLNDKGYRLSKILRDYISNYLRTYFDNNSLFDRKEIFDCFIYDYNRHCNFELDTTTKNIIYNFIVSNL